MKIKPDEMSRAIFMDPNFGPLFGCNWGDIEIQSDYGHSDLGSSYNHPQYPYGSIEAKTFLAGSYKFQVKEIEVF